MRKIGDVINETAGRPFYKRMDDFAKSVEALSINNYTTKNTAGVTSTVYHDGGELTIQKESISIQDIFGGSPAIDKILKEDYNTITAFVDVPESLSYNDYKQVIIYTTSFDYESIEDSRMPRCSVL